MDGLLINLKFYTLKSKTIQLFYGTDIEDLGLGLRKED